MDYLPCLEILISRPHSLIEILSRGLTKWIEDVGLISLVDWENGAKRLDLCQCCGMECVGLSVLVSRAFPLKLHFCLV